MMDLVPDLVEEILLRLPFKSILKFKTVSKQWRSILESRSFAERRPTIMNNVQKKPQILAAAGKHWTGSMLGDEEGVEMLYLHCDVATRPSLACDGLVCIPEPGWINVLNPSTRELLRFPSGPDPVKIVPYDPYQFFADNRYYSDIFPGHWRIGFGKDKVNGSYKVVRMIFEPKHYGEILDLNIGEWQKLLSPPPYHVGERSKSACVNGSIYWLRESKFYNEQKILALDLHTQEFRDVRTPPLFCQIGQVANLEDRLVLTKVTRIHSQWIVQVWSMDAQEETWTITYSIPFLHSTQYQYPWGQRWFMPVAVSKRGNLFLQDESKQLFKYYPKTGLLRRISADMCVISPFVENLLPLQRPASTPEIRTIQYLNHVRESQISKLFRKIELWIPNILITITVGATILKHVVHS